MYGYRGLGAATVVTDPATGEQKVVYDTATTVVVPTSGPNVYYDASGNVIGTGSTPSAGGDLTQWLNANAGKVAIGAGAFLALVLFAKAGR